MYSALGDIEYAEAGESRFFMFVVGGGDIVDASTRQRRFQYGNKSPDHSQRSGGCDPVFKCPGEDWDLEGRKCW